MKKKSKLMQVLGWFGPPRVGFWILLVLFIFGSMGIYVFMNRNTHQEISITELVKKIENNEVNQVVQADGMMYAIRKGEKKEAYQVQIERGMTVGQMLKTYGLTDAELKKLTVTVDGYRLNFESYYQIFMFSIMALVVGFLIWFSMRMEKGFSGVVGKKANTIGMQVTTRFTDVAGNAAAKKELAEMVEFLKDPGKFQKLGADIPKGALLKGPSGTGKTLLARAVAGETGVPFFYMSASEFIELYVGVGPARVREIFKRAKKESPAIIFIDEIDAIGGKRRSEGRNSEDDKTLNQLLTEMDGFEKEVKVIVIAATNNADNLDPALLRRLERQIYVSLPDAKDRLAILQIMITDKPMAEDVDLESVVRRSQGLSGDGLKSLVNEAAIRAAMENRETITQDDLLESIEKVLLGSADRRIVSETEKKVLAYHEAGHAVVTALLQSNSEVQKVTIASKGDRGGFVMNAVTEESMLHSYGELINQMAIALGGRLAEIIFDCGLSTGASDDLKKVNVIARAMVTKYGMGEKVKDMTLDENYSYSEDLLHLADNDVQILIRKASEKAEAIIRSNKEFVTAVQVALVEKETIEQLEFDTITNRFKLTQVS